MGEIGSGRCWGLGRPTCEDFHAVDLRKLLRDGMLWPGEARTLSWYWGDEQTGSISVVRGYDELELVYRVRSDSNDEWRDMRERVEIDYTNQHFGGQRAWLLCPHCRRRCAILYGGMRFLCRQCHGLSYASQKEHASERLLRRAQKLRKRLGGSANMMEPFPERPKGMHHRTYQRLWYQGHRMEAAMWGAVTERFRAYA